MQFRKLGAILGVKGLFCLLSLTTIASALVIYSSIVTLTPIKQLTMGTTTDSWTVYFNEVDIVKYLPGDSIAPTLDEESTDTYAFKVVTDAEKVCAIKVGLTTAMNSSQFSKFQIRVKYWDGSTWSSVPLSSSPTGISMLKMYINGLSAGDAGYVRHALSTTRYYLIEVTYSYDLVAETTPFTIDFNYTPFPYDSFINVEPLPTVLGI